VELSLDESNGALSKADQSCKAESRCLINILMRVLERIHSMLCKVEMLSEKIKGISTQVGRRGAHRSDAC
jgi:hypothetical protein